MYNLKNRVDVELLLKSLPIKTFMIWIEVHPYPQNVSNNYVIQFYYFFLF